MWLFRRTKRVRVDPRQHHRFEEPGNPGLAAVGMFRGANSPQDIAVTAAFQRPTRCAVPGCGKFHEDPIHTPADD